VGLSGESVLSYFMAFGKPKETGLKIHMLVSDLLQDVVRLGFSISRKYP